MKLVIDIPDNFNLENEVNTVDTPVIRKALKNGTPLPKEGRFVDISKIEKDRIEKDNPIIYLTIDGEYIEAISLDYLYNLQPIIETDEEGDEKENKNV